MSENATGIRKPFLRWAGSKRQIIPVLAEYWKTDYSRYIEPFAGSASLFFYLHPKKAVLGDLNHHLISTYRAVRDNPLSIARLLRSFEIGQRAYKEIRTSFNRESNGNRRAAQFIYLNRFCFNGLYRTNLDGAFNVPYGAHKSGSLPSTSELRSLSRLLQRCKLVRGDFENVLREAGSGDFIYMDPPFAVGARRVFREYHPETFADSDVGRLRKWLKILNRNGARFVVSYAQSKEAEILAEGFDVRKVFVRRNIAGFAGNRARALELLISN